MRKIIIVGIVMCLVFSSGCDTYITSEYPTSQLSNINYLEEDEFLFSREGHPANYECNDVLNIIRNGSFPSKVIEVYHRKEGNKSVWTTTIENPNVQEMYYEYYERICK